MKTIEIGRMPRITFAHAHEAPHYEASFSASHQSIEVAYIAKGALALTQAGERAVAMEGDVICLTHDVETTVSTEQFHAHHTVHAVLEWELLDHAGGLLLPLLTPASRGTEEIIKRIDACVYRPYLYTGSLAKSAGCFLDILCKIDACNRKSEAFRQPEASLWAERAKKYIHHHLSRPITQGEVAAHLGVSPGYLCHVFKRAEGVSLIKYVNTVKLQHIHRLISQGGVRLYEAAAAYGYADPNYVSYLYKKTFGYDITAHVTRPADE